MNRTDLPEFTRMINKLAAGFGREPSDPQTEVYWEALEGLSIEAFRAAYAIVRDAEKFMPPPAVILAAAPGRMGHVEAWTKLRQAAVSGTVDVPLAMRLALQKMGGSKRIAGADMETNDKREKEFEHVWACAVAEADASEALARKAAKASGHHRALPAAQPTTAREELGTFVGVEQKNKFLQQTFSEMSASSRFAREQAADPNPCTTRKEARK